MFKCERCNQPFNCSEANIKDGKRICAFCWNRPVDN